jgi:hypothetical protein
VTGHEEREAILRADRPHRTTGARSAREGGQLAVADDLAARQRAQHAEDGPLEVGAPLEVERNVSESDVLARQERTDTTDEL